ncbi:MAG: hypothetical protein IKL27_03770 [Oscillospiraceae bacterium]|nr:hypothetical protein [Oscillospiraceae bacterium]
MKKVDLMRTGLLLLAAVFVVLGVMRGETAVVLQKAVNICLECIGIG